MTFTHALITMVGGLLAASSLVLERVPDSRRAYERVAPYRALIGVALLAWGLYMLLFQLLHILGSLPSMPVQMLVYLASILADMAIGFLLGYGILLEHGLRRHPDAAERAAAWRSKLTRYQVPLGVVAFACGLGVLVMALP